MRGHKDMEWKEIPNYEGRYIINIDGDVIDLRPERNDDQHWTTKIEQRYLKTNNGYVNLTRGTQQKSKKINVLLRELFEEELLMSKEEMSELEEKAMTQDSITYTIEDFNRIIWPNKLLKLYDKTYNVSHHLDKKDRRKTLWRKPLEVPVKDGKILIKNGHTYFGYGLTNLIYINRCMIPRNGKPFEDPISKGYYQDRKYAHITELW